MMPETRIIPPCLSLVLGLFLAGQAYGGVDLWEQTNLFSRTFEAESVATGAILTNQESDVAWKCWTDDPKGQWSGGVVLQSPKVLADRASAAEGAPPLTGTLPSIPAGTYTLRFKIGRNLAFSTDRQKWVNLAKQGNAVKGVHHPGGDLVFYIDDLYGNPGSSGWSYFDAVTLEGMATGGKTMDLPRRPEGAAPFADPKPGDTFQESATYKDPVSGRTVRRLTSARDWNHLPTFHNRGNFTADSRFVIFTSWPDDRRTSWLLKGDVTTGQLTVLDALPNPATEGRYNGNNTAMNTAAGWALAYTYTQLLAVNLASREKKVLLSPGRGGPDQGHPAASIDGKTCYFAVRSNKPGGPQGYAILAVDVATGSNRAIFGEADYDCIHVQPNPVNPDLLLVVRDLAEKNPVHKEFTTENRCFILSLKSGSTTPLRPRDPGTGMLTHTVWSFDGTALYYETGITGNRHEVGRLDLGGNITWAHTFPRKGLAVHVGAHTKKDWMVLESEGLFNAPRDFRFLKFDEPGKNGLPGLEVICLHGSDMAAHGNRQEAHGHPIVSPDGKTMCFGVMREGKSDPHVVGL